MTQISSYQGQNKQPRLKYFELNIFRYHGFCKKNLLLMSTFQQKPVKFLIKDTNLPFHSPIYKEYVSELMILVCCLKSSKQFQCPTNTHSFDTSELFIQRLAPPHPNTTDKHFTHLSTVTY